MPLLRQSLYSQNVNLYLAPTADARDTWLPLMQTVAFEGRAVVLSCNQCVRQSHMPAWVTASKAKLEHKVETNPAKKADTADAQTDHSSAVANGAPTSPLEEVSPTASPYKSRRRSIMTEDHHEITWPEPKAGLAQHHQAPKTVHTESDPYICPGGSCIVSPLGRVLAGPTWNISDEDVDSLQVVEVDFDDCKRGRLDLDVAGSYSRSDAFKLSVEGLDLNPPPF